MTDTIRWDNCEIYINGVKLGALSAFAGQGYQPKQNIDSEHSVPPPKSDGREKAEEVDQNENSYYPVRHELIGDFERIGVTAYSKRQNGVKIEKRRNPFKGRPGLGWIQYFVKRSDLTHSVKLKWSRAADNDTWYICGFDVHVSMMDQDKSESAKTEELRQQVVIQAERIDALAAENAKLRQENVDLAIHQQVYITNENKEELKQVEDEILELRQALNSKCVAFYEQGNEMLDCLYSSVKSVDALLWKEKTAREECQKTIGELDRKNSELEKQNQVQQRRITELELAYRHSLDDLICAEANLSMLRRTHGL